MDRFFCFLSESLPKNIILNGQELALDVSTSAAVSCLLFLKNGTVSDNSKAFFCSLRLLGLSFEEVLTRTGCSAADLDKALGEFLAGAPRKRSVSTEKEQAPLFDFAQDSGAIAAAFRQNYGLSAEEVQSLHWWEFLTLFENLSGDTAFNSIKEIRAMKIDTKRDSPERIASIRKAKKAVELVTNCTKEEKRKSIQAQIDNAF